MFYKFNQSKKIIRELTCTSLMSMENAQPVFHIYNDEFFIAYNLSKMGFTSAESRLLKFSGCCGYQIQKSTSPHRLPQINEDYILEPGSIYEVHDSSWIKTLVTKSATHRGELLCHYIAVFPEHIVQVAALGMSEDYKLGSSKAALIQHLRVYNGPAEQTSASEPVSGNAKSTFSKLRADFEYLFMHEGTEFRNKAQDLSDRINALSQMDAILFSRELASELLKLEELPYAINPFGPITDIDQGALRTITRNRCQLFNAVLSSSANGYVREEALNSISIVLTEKELCFILPRLNDWVEKVRKRAHQLVSANTHHLSPKLVYEFLPLILLMRRRKQHAKEQYSDYFSDIITAPDFIPYLQEGLTSKVREVRHFCLNEYLKRPQQTIDEKILWCVQNAPFDLVRKAISFAQDENIKLSFETITEACKHSNGQVRKAALRSALVLEDEPAILELFKKHLLDPSPTVQDFCNYYAKERFHLDCAAFFQSKLEKASGQELAAALSGLNLTGVTLEASQIETFLQHPLVRVRCEALRNKGAQIEYFNKGLEDQSPKVIRRSIEIAAFHGNSLCEKKVTSFLLLSEEQCRSKAYLTYLNALHKYDKLAFLLSLYRRSGYDLRPLLDKEVSKWLRRRHTTYHPSVVQKYRKAFSIWQSAKTAFDNHVFLDAINGEFELLGLKKAEE